MLCVHFYKHFILLHGTSETQVQKLRLHLTTGVLKVIYKHPQIK